MSNIMAESRRDGRSGAAPVGAVRRIAYDHTLDRVTRCAGSGDAFHHYDHQGGVE